jgi:hypothetical protein
VADTAKRNNDRRSTASGVEDGAERDPNITGGLSPTAHQGLRSRYYFLFRCTLSMIIRTDTHIRHQKRTTPTVPSRSKRMVRTAVHPREFQTKQNQKIHEDD